MTKRLYYTDRISRVRRFDRSRRVARTHVGHPRPHRILSHFRRTTLRYRRLAAHASLDVVDRTKEGGRPRRRPTVGLRLVVGQTVHGAIDWARRFDHMQQHTGQHVLSAASIACSMRERRLPPRRRSWRRSISSRELTPRDLSAAEIEANAVVWANRPVDVRFATAEEAARLPLRKEAVRPGTLRLIDVEQFDLSPAAAPHVGTTGEIGEIAIRRDERFKGGQRVEFFCGGRALAKFRSMRDALHAGSVRLLSVVPGELPDAIEKLQSESRERQRSLVSLQQELARYRAGSWRP